MPEMHVYLIGAGVIAQHHATAVAKLPQAVALHAADPNPAALSAFAQKFPTARIFSDYTEMLSQPAHETDIVIVATPPFAHHDPAIDALNSRRHVLCEKPLALNRAQAFHMFETAQKHDRLVGCCSTRFLNLPAAARVKQMIHDGTLGDVYHINWINRRNRMRSGVEYQPQSRWFLDPAKSGGGVLMDWGPYDFAALGELLDPVRLDVRSAWLATPKTAADPIPLAVEHHLSASLLLHRADGSTIPISYERASCTHGEERVGPQIEGTRGAVKWDWLGNAANKLHLSRDNAGKLETITTEHPPTDHIGPHDKPLIFFHRAMLAQPSPAIINQRALFNFSCIRAIYDAASSAQPQSVFL
jgi:predicted dehydrogenase